MSAEHHPGPPSPSEVLSLEALRQQALQTVETITAPVGAAETRSANEVESQPEPINPIDRLTSVTAEAKELKRALALDYLALMPQPETTAEVSPSARIHSVHVKGHRAPKRDTADKVHELQQERQHRAKAAKERPNWEQHFPADTTPDNIRKYEEWRSQFPVTMQANIEALRLISGEEARLLDNPDVKATWEAKGAEKQAVLQAAASVRIVERREHELGKEIIHIKSSARKSGRELTPPERQYITSLQEAAAGMRQEIAPYLANKQVVEELRRRDAIEDSMQLKGGLLETDQMRKVVELTMPSLAEGKPLLLFGETGGAKTSLAFHMAREYLGVEPELVSGHAEVNAYQVMGKTGLKATGEGTETVFNPGPLFTAMAEGKPVILDEIDAMPSSFLIRLNYILQLRPGDKLRVQEDSNQEITIKEGFCIIATANIKSARYNREEMDPAFLQRFRYGAGIEHIPYPDHDVPEGQVPRENWRLAIGLLTDTQGNVTLPPGMGVADLKNLLQASHASQRMFTQPAAVAGANFVDSQRVTQGKPALEKAVLAPREWMGIISQVKSTDGGLSLSEALGRFIAGQTVQSDREVLAKLLASHDLLNDASEEALRIPPGSLQGFRHEPAQAA